MLVGVVRERDRQAETERRSVIEGILTGQITTHRKIFT